MPRVWEGERVESVLRLVLWHPEHVVQAALPLSPSSASIAESMLVGTVC